MAINSNAGVYIEARRLGLLKLHWGLTSFMIFIILTCSNTHYSHWTILIAQDEGHSTSRRLETNTCTRLPFPNPELHLHPPKSVPFAKSQFPNADEFHITVQQITCDSVRAFGCPPEGLSKSIPKSPSLGPSPNLYPYSTFLTMRIWSPS